MFDIEVIDGYRVAVITPDCPATKLLKAFYSALVMKRLSGEPVEHTVYLNSVEFSSKWGEHANSGLERAVKFLKSADLISTHVGYYYSAFGCYYGSTEYGLEVYRRIREGEEEIEIPLE